MRRTYPGAEVGPPAPDGLGTGSGPRAPDAGV